LPITLICDKILIRKGEVVRGKGMNKKNFFERMQDSTNYDLCPQEEKEEKTDEYLLLYIVSFIVPLAGFLLGAKRLAQEEKEERDEGKRYIIIAILSIIINGTIVMFFSYLE